MLSTPEVHPRFSFPCHVLLSGWRRSDTGSSLCFFSLRFFLSFFFGFSYVEIKSSAFQSQRVNKKIIGSGPAICILNKVIAMPD
jgi:hypothetical protein